MLLKQYLESVYRKPNEATKNCRNMKDAQKLLRKIERRVRAYVQDVSHGQYFVGMDNLEPNTKRRNYR